MIRHVTEMCIAVLSLAGHCVSEVERQSLTKHLNSKHCADCFATAEAKGIATLTYFAVSCLDYVSFPCQSAIKISITGVVSASMGSQ